MWLYAYQQFVRSSPANVSCPLSSKSQFICYNKLDEGAKRKKVDYMETWEQINAVTQMQDYIKTHLDEPITLHILAQMAGYSPWHCAKLFKELTGKAPFEYIRMCRLSKAALELRDHDLKIVDVAMDFVFDSHEGFSRAFRRQFGVSPNEYKKNTPPIHLFHPWPVREYYYWLKGGEKAKSTPLEQSFTIQVQNFPKRKLLLKRGKEADNYFAYSEEAGCGIWGLLCSIKQALYEPIGLWLPASLRPPNTSEYAQGVEVPFTYTGIVPEGFDLIDLPECAMMMFQSAPYDDIYFEEVILALAEVIDAYDPMADGYEWADEMAPRIQLEPQGWRGYIEARPVRKHASK